VQLAVSQIAVLFIGCQNDFATVDSKLHGFSKDDVEVTDMLNKSMLVVKEIRAAGGKAFHAPFQDGVSTLGSWKPDICGTIVPKACDVVVVGKTGLLDVFPSTNLEAQLITHGIKTIVLGGFLTNCCTESTLRMACKNGFNVITLTDCMATTSIEGETLATEGTCAVPCLPMTAEDFIGELQTSAATADLSPKFRSNASSDVSTCTPSSSIRSFSVYCMP